MFNAFRLGMFLMLAAVVLGAAGCGKTKEEVAEKAFEKAMEQDGSKAKVDLSKKQVSIQTKDGQKIEMASGDQSLKVPADFPKDIYIYDQASVMGSVTTPDGRTLNLATPDPVEKVAAQYKAKMTAAGWKESTASAMAGMTMLAYAKGKQEVMVHITHAGDKTQIMLLLQQAAE